MVISEICIFIYLFYKIGSIRKILDIKIFFLDLIYACMIWQIWLYLFLFCKFGLHICCLPCNFACDLIGLILHGYDSLYANLITCTRMLGAMSDVSNDTC